MRLLLIRHAETEHNRDSRVQGQADIPLSDLGRRQAAALADWLRASQLDAVYASPLCRALTTAEAIAEEHGLTVTVEPALMEMNVGEMEGLTTVEMRQRFPDFLKVWASEDGHTAVMPGGECLQEVQDRAWQVVERLRAAHTDQTVALVSHNFVLGSLITRAMDMRLSDFRRFRLSVAGMTTLLFRQDRIMLVRLNETCHLTQSGLVAGEPWPRRA